jgi:dextranase
MRWPSVFVFALLVALTCIGGIVYAVEASVDVRPDKGFYTPGQPVRLLVSATGGERITAHIMHLTQTAARLEAPLRAGQAEIVWTPPAVSPRGYGVDVELLAADGSLLATTSTAFDVLDHWTQAPRYGFLSEFTAARADPQETMAWAARYHLNGLQFYDWQYRHEQLLPPAGSDHYTDLLGREMSLAVVEALIDAAHEHNIAAMPYTAIYGASAACYRQHPDWALFSAPGRPYEFGENFLIIMNPAPGTPWTRHLLDQFAGVLDQTGFDGIHIDQYGAPMRGWDAEGRLVHLDRAFPQFIDDTAELVARKRGVGGAVIFNAVRNWPLAAVAPSQQDAVYVEVWEPYRSLLDLYRIIAQAQHLSGGKPVILAAYIPPEQEINARLANALIFAAGGYHIELGEPGAMLADPYFPNFGQMNAHMQDVTRRYYDFAVRYENLLALDTGDATAQRAYAVTLEGIPTQGTRARDRVVVIVRAGEKAEAFSLINLIGIDGEYWDAPLTQAPTPQHSINVRVQVERAVSRVYSMSPDGSQAAPRPIDFTTGEGLINFQLPQLDYWTVFVLEYAE